MKVIIPVAGIGTRLKPHTNTQPKPLLKVGGKTIIDHLLKPITGLMPDEVIFVIGYKGDMIKDYVRENYSFKSTFIRQDKLLGLGYALHIALEKIEESPLLILLGDTIVEGNLKKFVATGDYVLGLRKVDDPKRFGIAEISRKRIVGLEEKPKNPKSDLALIGLYYFSESGRLKARLRSLVDAGKRTRGEIQLTDALAAMIDDGVKFAPYEVEGWLDCGKKETMLATNRHVLSNSPEPQPSEGVRFVPPVFIGENVVIENSVVGPYVSVGDGSRIKSSVISNSIIGSGVRIENLVTEDSIIGNGATVKGQKKVLNIGDSSDLTGF